jgi:hypothetical protein
VMNDCRAGGSATLLFNGKVLIAGGATCSQATYKNTEIYTP